VKLYISALQKDHVKCVYCHHGMARPLVAEGEDGLQIWMVAANILNKQSRTTDSGWSSILGVGRGLTTLAQTKNSILVTKHYAQPRNRTDYLARPKDWKMDLRYALIDASKEVGLEVNPEKTKYMLVSRCQGRTEAEHKDRE
jgi:hypothetical protein